MERSKRVVAQLVSNLRRRPHSCRGMTSRRRLGRTIPRGRLAPRDLHPHHDRLAGHRRARRRSPPARPRRTSARFGDPVAGPGDVDERGTALPTALQRQAARRPGRRDGPLELPRHARLDPPGQRQPRRRARRPRRRRPRPGCATTPALFGMSAAAVDGLELVSSQKLAQSPARAVLFRQDFGGVAPALGGLVTVGVADGKVAYVSSSLARTTSAMPAASLTPLQGWLKAATDLSVGVPAARGRRHHEDGERRLDPADRPRLRPGAAGAPAGPADGRRHRAPGPRGQRGQRRRRRLARLHQPRRRRHGRGARPPQQVRELRLQQRLPGHGDLPPAADPSTPSSSTDDLTRTINAVAVGVPADDFVIKLFQGDTLLTTADTATNPEVATYTAASIPGGTYSAQVCAFDAASILVGQYALAVSTSDTAAPGTGDLTGNPRWRYFTANPTLDSPDRDPEQLGGRLLERRRRRAPRRPPRCATSPPSARGTPSARCRPSRPSATTPTRTRPGSAR